MTDPLTLTTEDPAIALELLGDVFASVTTLPATTAMISMNEVTVRVMAEPTFQRLRARACGEI